MKKKSDHDSSISLIADYDGDIRNIFDVELPEKFPLLILRNMVMFPSIVVPVGVERKFSLKLVEKALKTNSYIGVVCQKSDDIENPTQKDLFTIGTIAKVVRILELPDGKITVLLQGHCRFLLSSIIQTTPFHMCTGVALEEELADDKDKQMKALVEACKESTLRVAKYTEGSGEFAYTIKNITNPTFLLNFIASNLNIPNNDKVKLLAIGNEKKRAESLIQYLNKELQFLKLKAEIQSRTQEELDQQQKEYFLHQQIKNMQEELGESPSDQDIAELTALASKKKLPEDVRNVFNKEIKKLERINLQSPDYNVQLNYLQTLLSLPWGEFTKDNNDLSNAQKTLDADHYGLEKIKERILEHLAVLKLKKDMKSPIICLYGPPGVGKTSLGRSIAKALKRKYVRISLGGVHDESEIRGHRRTYIGAMPGRIIKGLIKSGSNNPVFVLDEIDKISTSSINGDPSSALLEVLDPEQNSAFHDNFIDVDYDLSNVMFIATANSLSTIPAPLLDRMELIEVSGYITEEKIEIAKHFLVPKAKENNGLKTCRNLTIKKDVLEKVIEQYTRESGVRQLDKLVNKMMRKVAFNIAKDADVAVKSISKDDVIPMLGQPPFIRDIYQGNSYAGVVTGLAWTSVGGEILYIETSLSQGKAGKLTLTGNLGDVMKESATLALEYIKAHADELNINKEIFNNWNIHIHVPEGATPKDGPSAGITIATSLASALTQRKVREKTAMTGEITLRGKVLPVGGIKEKILAAKRAGISSIILSKENRKDIAEINSIYLKGLTFDYVEDVKDVLQLALLEEKVENPIDFTVLEDSNNADKV